MSEELKPCPWCGKMDTDGCLPYYAGLSVVGCESCSQGVVAVDALSAWNALPRTVPAAPSDRERLVFDALVIASRLIERHIPPFAQQMTPATADDHETLKTIQAIIAGLPLKISGDFHACEDCGFYGKMDEFRCDEDRLYCPRCGWDGVTLVAALADTTSNDGG